MEVKVYPIMLQQKTGMRITIMSATITIYISTADVVSVYILLKSVNIIYHMSLRDTTPPPLTLIMILSRIRV